MILPFGAAARAPGFRAMPLLRSLSRREIAPELMDDPRLDPAEHRRALTGLRRLNRWSRAAAAFWPTLRRLALGGKPVRLLDVATGSGDVPLTLARWAKAAGFEVEVHGCDVSDTALSVARSRAVGVNATFFRHDAVADPLPGGFDLVTCSLFLHHLPVAEVVTVLRHMADAGRAVVVSDLARGRLNFVLVWLASHTLTRSRVVRFDGPVSVRAAFTPAEVRQLAEEAGLGGATVQRLWPCRMLLTWGGP
jgi:2-polyprenyl-3-methyl-5-hydroxy-6-metoxy-1,4-benzoquinol methylase